MCSGKRTRRRLPLPRPPFSERRTTSSIARSSSPWSGKRPGQSLTDSTSETAAAGGLHTSRSRLLHAVSGFREHRISHSPTRNWRWREGSRAHARVRGISSRLSRGAARTAARGVSGRPGGPETTFSLMGGGIRRRERRSWLPHTTGGQGACGCWPGRRQGCRISGTRLH